MGRIEDLKVLSFGFDVEFALWDVEVSVMSDSLKEIMRGVRMHLQGLLVLREMFRRWEKQLEAWIRPPLFGSTPLKTTMEPKNHPIEKENHLPIFQVYIMDFICMTTWYFYYKNDDFEMFSDV